MNVKAGERECEPVEEWGSEMLGERVGTRDVAIEPRLRDTRTEKRRAARRTRRRSARPKGEEGRECRGLTPLAPGPGDVDCSAANTHHSRNQAGVRGWGSRVIGPAWCVHILIETNRDLQNELFLFHKHEHR